MIRAVQRAKELKRLRVEVKELKAELEKQPAAEQAAIPANAAEADAPDTPAKNK